MSKLITKREIAFQQREIAKNRLKNMMSEIAHQESLPKEPKPEKGKVGRPRGSIEKDTYKQVPPAPERGLPKVDERKTALERLVPLERRSEPCEEYVEEEEDEYEDDEEYEEDEGHAQAWEEEDETEDEEEDEQDIIYVQKKRAPKKIKKVVEKVQKVQKPNAAPSRGKRQIGGGKVSGDEDIRKALLDLIQNMQRPSEPEQPVEQPKSNPPPSSLPYKRETVQMAYNSLLF